jgi:fluoroquinolone transport system ATP-binding protein
MGVGFELPNNFSQLTGLENLQLFSSLYGKTTLEPMKALEMMDLQEAAKQRVKNYSKGMMMRLNFVRSILHDPQLLFLDEPTAGLDPVNARKLKDIVLSLKEQGKTVFLTTHRMEDADELCDRIAFIVEGELKLIDTPRNLKLQHGQKVVEVEHRLDGERVQESFALEALNQDERFRQILDSGTLETIHSQEASLEDVFIKTTGRTLV